MATTQPVNPNTNFQSQPPQHYSKPPLIIILTVILLVVFFIGFCALYFCKCFFHTFTEAWNRHVSPQNQIQSNQDPNLPPVNPGLEPEIIESFPSFPFSSIKNLREDKCGLECAICLLEFEQEHILLRLLTTCYHIFHQECIDQWLVSHKTCPVCRRNLDPNAPENIKEMIIDVIHENREESHDETTISNDVLMSREGGNSKNERKVESLLDKLSRSKTTGHSIVRKKPEEEDRFTLRLPDHVKIKVTRRYSNNQTESCVSFGELMKIRGAGRFGEVSGQSLEPKSDN